MPLSSRDRCCVKTESVRDKPRRAERARRREADISCSRSAYGVAAPAVGFMRRLLVNTPLIMRCIDAGLSVARDWRA